MRVACIGNMNNNFFALVRYLRDCGIDAHLILLNNEITHFHPSQDTFDLRYQEYTHRVSWGDPFTFLNVSPKQIQQDVKDYDFIIACDVVPAYLMKINRPVDIFVPFGSDLYFYPFMRLIPNPRKQINYYYCSKYQRLGIQKAEYMSFTPTNKGFQQVIEQIKYFGKTLNFGVPMIYTPLFNPQNITKYYDRSHWRVEFQFLRENYNFIIFHHSRQIWKNIPDPFSNKGNDLLVKGFAKFVHEVKNSEIKPCLIMLEYGKDINETKNLVHELKIESNVKWFPLMARKDILIGINFSDIVAGQFRISWLAYGAVYEALAMGKPIMHRRDDFLYKNIFPDLYPMISVKNSEDIYEALIAYINNPDYFQNIGRLGKNWLQKYLIENAVECYTKLIFNKEKSEKSNVNTKSYVNL